MLRKALHRNHGPLRDEEIARLFREIMSACLAPAGTAESRFPRPGGHVHPGRGASSISARPCARCRWPPIDEVFHEVEGRRRRFRRGAHRELERGHGQPYARHVSDLVAQDLRRGGAAHPPPSDGPHEHARGRPRVCAHPQALAQCRGWLDEQLPEVERIAVSSNAEGARRARDERGTAAIASRAAAEIYGLTLLADEIEDRPDNTTRFLVIGRKLFSASGADRTTLLVSATDTDDAGALFRLLEAVRRAPGQHDAHRIAALAQAQMGLCVLHRRRGSRERPAARARRSPRSRSAPRCSRFSAPIREPCFDGCATRLARSGLRTIHAQPASGVAGSIAVPGDKSISHRAILLSALATGSSEVSGFLASEDCLASLAAMRAMGVDIERPAPTELRCGAPACTASRRRDMTWTWAMRERRCACSPGCCRRRSSIRDWSATNP